MREQIWNLETIDTVQTNIGKELLPYVENEMYIEGIQHCLHKILPLESNELGDLEIICYIISTLNLVSFSEDGASEYKSLVIKLEKIAKALLEKNNVKPGKSKFSFLHGQLKQGVASILKNEGDTWGALWESSLGLFLSRGSANPVQPFQHISFASQTVDRGFPQRVMAIIEEVKDNMVTDWDQYRLSLLKIKALRLSGKVEASEEIIDRLIAEKGKRDRLVWEKAFTRAIVHGETKELHRTLFSRNKPQISYAEAYLKYAFWMKAQPSKVHAKLCPKVSTLKRIVKGKIAPNKFKKLFKVLQTIEEAYDVNIPMITRVNKIGRVMPLIETLDAEYRVLALATIVRWLNQRQKQMASLFHGEYQSQCLKMSEGANNDVFKLFEHNGELDVIKPFYDTLHNHPNCSNQEAPIEPISKVLFRSTKQDLKMMSNFAS